MQEIAFSLLLQFEWKPFLIVEAKQREVGDKGHELQLL
jgi:hypothetical protein